MDLSWLTKAPVAHRALHDGDDGRPENSLAAVEAAIARGFAIEVDLQASADGEAFVFHDHTLDRLTDFSGPLMHYRTPALREIRLTGSDERLPTLADLLDTVRGRVPLVLELKSFGAPGALEKRVAECLMGYDGPIAVMSFNPASIGWFVANRPDLPRGQVACTHASLIAAGLGIADALCLQHLLVMEISRPHFIAYDVKDAHRPAPQLARKAGKPLLTWTVRSPEQAGAAGRIADNIIFEDFDPCPAKT